MSQSALAQLPSVTSYDCLRSVSGEFFLECFAGHAAFTLAVVMSQVPALRPWEITHDHRFDVLAGLPILLAGIRLGIIVAMHIGTPCHSFTMARVPAVRSKVFPLGFPDLTETQAQFVDMGNRLASVSAKLCCALYAAGGYFSLENPERSLLWIHPDILELFGLSGVASVLVYYNAYGALFVKPTVFLHNAPTFHHLYRPPPWSDIPLIELRGWVTFQGVKTARTLLAQPYPPKLAVAYGDLLADALQHRALASSEGQLMPMAVPEHTFGHPIFGLTWEHPVLRASAGS